jgi:AraC family transcriptional regulator of adaptative response/methylated-DNA-[protein]-cysteine methyltransferase
MADMLDHLSVHWRTHPSLAELADRAKLSPAHFQRLFTRWAGVSPKRLIAAYAHTAARDLFDTGATLEEIADDVGLSAPSRLYDLCVAHEGVTPGAIKQRGAGLVLHYGVADSPFGQAVVAVAPLGIAGLAFCDAGQETEMLADLTARFPAATWTEDRALAARTLDTLFGPATASAPLALYGTAFHLQVWKALLAIPEGSTTTYGAIARAIGNPAAVRAVGAAVGANPISWLIPCHRVLASDGQLNGYHWGLRRKAAMLSYETLRTQGRV